MSDFSRHQYHTLDGMRGVAAMLIVLFHTSDYFGGLRFPESYLAVDLFFVLSGFVIARAYQARLQQGMSGWAFLRVRLIRLYPLYALATVLGLLSVAASVLAGQNAAGWSRADLFVNAGFALLMLPSVLTPQLYPVNAPSWSLWFELIANILYGYLHGWLTSLRLWLVVALSALALLCSALALGSLDVGYQWSTALIGLPRVLYSFGVGLLIARLSIRRSGTSTSPSSQSSAAMGQRDMGQRTFKFPTWLLLALVLAVLCASPATSWRPWYDLGAVLFGFPVLVWLACQTEARWAVLRRGYAFFGAISYALYVLHVPLALLANNASKKLWRAELAAFAPVSGIALVLLLAGLSWWLDRVYDQPLRRWLARYGK